MWVGERSAWNASIPISLGACKLCPGSVNSGGTWQVAHFPGPSKTAFPRSKADRHADAQKGCKSGKSEYEKSRRVRNQEPTSCALDDDGSVMKRPALTKAELRAQGDLAVAAATKPIVNLPTKLVRQCGRCGEFSSAMVEPGHPPPEFKCKSCDKPPRRG